jgi:hypothetical protein
MALVCSTKSKFFIKAASILFASMAGVNLGAGLIFFLIAGYYSGVLRMTAKQFYLIVAFCFLGLVISGLAPGNFIRASKTAGIHFSPQLILLGFLTVLRDYIDMSKGIIIAGVACASAILTLKLNDPKSIQTSVRWSVVLFIAAIATISPFVIVPSAASRHTAIHFQTFLLPAVTFLFYAFMLKFKIQNRFRWAPLMVVNSFLLFFILIGIDQYHKGTDVKRQVELRYKELALLTKEPKRAVIFSKIEMPDYFFASPFAQFSSDSLDQQNRCLQNYFKTGGIVVVDKLN